MGRKKKEKTKTSIAKVISGDLSSVVPQINEVPLTGKAITNETNAIYAGSVNIVYKTADGKEIIYKKHNEGLPGMCRFLCMALAGNFSSAHNDKPTYMDLRCTYTDESAEGDDKTKTVSCLYSIVPLSAPMYYFDDSPEVQSWVTVFDIGLSYNMINYDIINAHSDGTFYLYITSASGTDFARLMLENSAQIVTRILPGTQAIVQWTMKILNESQKIN